jgi:2,3-bisphosphoglycerate-dependent phosphoglycerate mutase
MLILLRHGQSAWNKENLFTGWVDIPMSEEGIREAIGAGERIKEIPIDIVFTSTLFRAQMTIPFAFYHHKSGKIPVFLHPDQRRLDEWGQVYSEEAKKSLIPVFQAWELNERMYGHLQGLNKAETADLWRRSFDVAPPEGESLEMTAARTIPYFKKYILPHLQKGETVLISAHGNSLRSIAMHIENLTKEEVVALELPTGSPRLYSFKNGRYDLL